MSQFPERLAASVKSAMRAACIGLILIPTVSCRGASPDWNGTWKLDPAKSYLPVGTAIVVSISPDGMWHNSGGGGTSNFRCDGKRYQATDILVVDCTQANSSDVEITAFKDGSKVLIAHWELSADGKVLSIKSTNFHEGGSVKTKEHRYARTSGLVGFAGGWRNENPLEEVPSIRRISLQGHILHESFPEEERYIDVTLDGTDAAIHGRLAVPSVTFALEERSARKFSSTMKVHGQVVTFGYWQISPDGRSLTESYWAPSRPNEKAVLTYEKQ
jgi:hypothetical protein